MHHKRTADLLLSLVEGDGSGAGTGGHTPTFNDEGGKRSDGSEGGKPADTGNTGTSNGTGNGTGKNTTAGHSVDNLPQWAQNLVRELRDEAGDSRTKKNAAEKRAEELMSGIAAALGVKGDEKKDPEKLTADLAQSAERVRTLETELAVYKHAPAAGADPLALLDSRSFVDTLAGLDPAASDYATRITDKIKTALEANPRLGTTGSGSASPFRPARSGIGQERPGTGHQATGVAAGRELRRARQPQGRPATGAPTEQQTAYTR